MSDDRRRRPVILAVGDEPAVLAAVARDLRRGFGERYQVLRAPSGPEALELLGQARARGLQIALLIADQRMPGMSGTEYLVEARKVVPDAKRVLLTAYADTDAAISAINEVALDYYLLKPWDPPEQQLRLASLGTMAAGLANELNNPAAAAKRAASDLGEALQVVSRTIERFVESGVERAEAAELVERHRALLARAEGRTPLDALDAADAEDALTDLLDELRVAEPWRIAEPLAAAGADEEWVRDVARLAGPATDAALPWVAASLTARALAEEVRDSASRMSDLVGAVKTYAYMDRGELVEADVHEGLETTLVVLGHKLKHTAIRVEREYDRELPRLTVHGGELNQVWTNLLDNAIDALGGSGTITLRTRRDGPCAFVEVADDGPGIPPEVAERVFEPFFTTKEVGRGTGLGLDTARRIVTERHGGSIAVDSRPGATTFRVWLPLGG